MSFTEQWRLVKGPEGCTKIPQPTKVADLDNPGEVYIFRDHIYVKKEGVFVLCDAKDEQKARLILLERGEEEDRKRKEEKKAIAERGLANGWPPKIVFMRI